MVATYTIFGRQVGSHVLSIATLTSMGLAAFLATGASEKKKIDQGPPTNSTSKDEEAFIQEFIKNANAEEQKAKH
ncbi:hypothetical protein MMC09_000811 [Bachmanniomyces sp. S44760]|nr:hypothetical protein [Bachmanniomyces sp. S44760]